MIAAERDRLLVQCAQACRRTLEEFPELAVDPLDATMDTLELALRWLDESELTSWLLALGASAEAFLSRRV